MSIEQPADDRRPSIQRAPVPADSQHHIDRLCPNGLSSQFLSPGAPPWKDERGVRSTHSLIRSLLIQPVVQFYDNVGGRGGRAVVVGFRTKLDLRRRSYARRRMVNASFWFLLPALALGFR